MSYYPPPPGVGGPAHNNSLPQRPQSSQLDFRPPPPGGHNSNNAGGGGGRRGGGRPRNGRNRDNDRNSNGGNSNNGRNNNSYNSNSNSYNGSYNGGLSGFAPPQGDFTFRSDKPAGVQEAQQRGDYYTPREQSRRDQFQSREPVRRGGRPPPSGPKAQQQYGGGRRGDRGIDSYSSYNNNNSNNGNNRSNNYNSRGRYGGRGGGNFSSSRFLAANRPILTQTQQPGAGGMIQNFVKSDEGTTYLNLDDLSDSDEAEMDISGDEAGEAGEIDEDGDAPPRKRARYSAKSADTETAAPKWSNPDPYTVLPPTETTGGKKKDVVHLIRKARVKADRASALTSGDTEDFISCNWDSSSDEEAGEVEYEEAEELEDGETDDNDKEEGEATNSGDDQSRIARIGRNGRIGDESGRDALPANEKPSLQTNTLLLSSSVNTKASVNNKNNTPPADAPKGPRGSNVKSAAPINTAAIPLASSLATELNTTRKRTYNDELKPLLLPDHAILKRATKMPVGGYILPAWQVKKNEPTCPWMDDGDDDEGSTVSSRQTTSHMGVWLHKEIVDFYSYVRPRDFEQALRQALLNDLESLVRKRFSNGRMHCFGSFMSGLYLPTGDMDIVMCSTQFLNSRQPVFSKKGHLFKFGSFLCQNRLAEREHLEHITKAKVPLVKYIDLKTGLKVDVSFENMNGVVANQTFTQWKQQFPEMPILVTLIKQFLMMRGLNEPVNGGIGGFSVICLVVSMLQLMPPLQTKDMVGQNHLGDLLMHFFDLYGNKFNYETTAISLNPPGYIPKSKVRNFSYKNPDRLSIIDPNNPDNDISGGSKNTPAIMRVFSDAFDAIQKRMVELAKLPLDKRAHESILSVVLEGDYSTYRNQRDYLREV